MSLRLVAYSWFYFNAFCIRIAVAAIGLLSVLCMIQSSPFPIYVKFCSKTGFLILRSSFAVRSLFVRSSFEAGICSSVYFS